MQPIVLTIAGSDAGGGAGVQADIKAIVANGGYPASVITAVTAQNTREVRGAEEVGPAMIRAQIDALFDDLEIGAVKTGMLASRSVIRVVAERLRERRPPCLVCDPVMVAKSGDALLSLDAVDALLTEIAPIATLLTPNTEEARALTDIEIVDVDDAERAGRRLVELGGAAVLVKGGHLRGDRAVDVLVTANEVHRFDAPRIDSRHTHGTGCTYASAIATHLAHGAALVEAVGRSKEFVTRAIEAGLAVGRGTGPVDAFFFLRDGDRVPWRAYAPQGEPSKR